MRFKCSLSICLLNGRYASFLLIPAAIGFCVTDRAYAAALAMDTASDAAYAAEDGGAWKGVDPTADENPPGTDNGGFGFQPWDFSGGYHQSQYSPYDQLNHFIDGIDFAASSFNNLGSPAFGLTNANLAFGGHTSRATRIFESPLSVGNTVTVDFDNPLPTPLDPFAPAGYLLRLNAGGGPLIAGDPTVIERFGLFVTSGFNSDNWTTTDSAGFVDSGLNADDTITGAEFRFKLTSSDSYSFELVRLSDGHILFARSGMLAAPAAGPIDSLEITLFSNGSGDGRVGPVAQPTGEREFFFNDLRIESDAAVLAGDYNGDGVVDAADFVVWRRTLGQSVDPGSGADGDNSGAVGPPDYDVWRANFGRTSMAAGKAITVVPEPSAMRLAIVGVACALARFPSCRRYGALDASSMEFTARWPHWAATWEISVGRARSK